MADNKFSKLKFKFRAFKYRFRNDTSELKYILANVNKNDSVIDIGAHKGAYLYWLRKAVGNNGSIEAFEPQPLLYKYLNDMIDSFGFKNITLNHAGVSSQAGEMNLFVPKAEGFTSPGATFEKRDSSIKGHFHTIPVLTLDEHCKNRSKPITLIKMDVEGHELDAFKGAQEILSTDKPKLIFECENRHLNDKKVEDVFHFLEERGYQGYYFWKGRLEPNSSFESEKHQRINDKKEILDKENYANNFVFESK